MAYHFSFSNRENWIRVKIKAQNYGWYFASSDWPIFLKNRGLDPAVYPSDLRKFESSELEFLAPEMDQNGSFLCSESLEPQHGCTFWGESRLQFFPRHDELIATVWDYFGEDESMNIHLQSIFVLVNDVPRSSIP